jgi:hypothetical protein
MDQSAIRIGAKYSNPTSRYGGVRVVDAIVTRANGLRAVVWCRSGAGTGHTHGVSLLATFARWARQEEAMSADDLTKHELRAKTQAEARVRFGGEVAKMLSTTT